MANLSKLSQPLLVFDTSERVATVSICNADRTLAQIGAESWFAQSSSGEHPGKSTALVSMIQSLVKTAEIETAQLGAIGLSNGPGSFTGLRVGVVTARMLCYAWNLPVIVVSSLEVAAEKLRRERDLQPGTRIWSATNAQRRQIFAAQYEVQGDGSLKIATAQSLFEREAIVELLNPNDQVTGSGSLLFGEAIEHKTKVTLPGPKQACCDAEGVSMLVRRRFEAGDFDELLSIEPVYFRPSAAEEVRLARDAAK